MSMRTKLNLGIPSGGTATKWYHLPSLRLNGVSPSYISQFDNNRYYSSTAGTRAFPYTFSRVSNATQFDSSGRLIWAPTNMFLSGLFHGTGWGTSGAGTTCTATGIASPTGQVYSKLVAGNTLTLNANDDIGAVRLSSAITIPSGATWCFSFYATAAELSVIRVRESVSSGYRATVDLTTGIVTTESGTATLTGGMVVTTEAAGTGIWRIICKRTANTTTFNIGVKQGATTGDGTSGVYISSGQFELNDATSPKSYNHTSGTAYYAPRLDYNPNGNTARGLLMERAATNLCPTSGEGSSSVTATNGSKADSGAVFFGRVGTTYTGGNVGGVSNFANFAAPAVAPTASTQYAVSVYVKAGTRTKCQLTVSANYAAVDCYANFDLSNGAVLASGAGASNVLATNCGNGVWRLSFAFTTIGVPVTGAAVIIAYIDTDTATRIPNVAANTDTIDIYGCQLELGAGPTSYIPTFNASATRAVETATETLGAWFDTTKGTMYSHFETQNQTLSTFPNSFWIHDGTANNRLSQYMNASTGGGNFEVRSGAVTSATISVAGTFIGVHKLASRWNTTGTVSQSSRDGTAGTEDNTTTVPTVTTLSVGGNATSTEPLNGWVREVLYYPDASASDAQLNALTI